MRRSVPRNTNAPLGIMMKVVTPEDTRKGDGTEIPIAGAINLVEFMTSRQICFDEITIKPIIFEWIPIRHIGCELIDETQQNSDKYHH